MFDIGYLHLNYSNATKILDDLKTLTYYNHKKLLYHYLKMHPQQSEVVIFFLQKLKPIKFFFLITITCNKQITLIFMCIYRGNRMKYFGNSVLTKIILSPIPPFLSLFFFLPTTATYFFTKITQTQHCRVPTSPQAFNDAHISNDKLTAQNKPPIFLPPLTKKHSSS